MIFLKIGGDNNVNILIIMRYISKFHKVFAINSQFHRAFHASFPQWLTMEKKHDFVFLRMFIRVSFGHFFKTKEGKRGDVLLRPSQPFDNVL